MNKFKRLVTWLPRVVYMITWILMLTAGMPMSLSAEHAAESIAITGIEFDQQSLNRLANGADIWPATWAVDNNVYIAGGDGDGCDGNDTRGLDIDRLDGGPTSDLSASCTEVHNEAGYLTKGMLAVDGTLYRLDQERGDQNNDGYGFSAARLCSSSDNGVTWTCPSGFHYIATHFAQGHLINYGKDYAGARDSFVYMVGHEDANADFGAVPFDRVVLARMPKNQICGTSNVCSSTDTSTHEYYAGTDGNGNPLWTSDLSNRAAIYSDEGSMHWGVTINYNPVLRRYLLCYFVDDNANLSCHEGPEPWGPWTEIYSGQLFDSSEKYSLFFVNKNDGEDNWISDDGKTWWFLTSGMGNWDSINVVRATLTTSGSGGPPSTPDELQAR